MKTPEQFRLEAGLTQAQLADRAGVSPACVSRMLKGECVQLRPVTLQKIGAALIERFKERGAKLTLEDFIASCIAARDKFLNRIRPT